MSNDTNTHVKQPLTSVEAFVTIQERRVGQNNEPQQKSWNKASVIFEIKEILNY